MPPTPLPRVDVGIVTYNTCELTLASLRQVLAALDGVDARILLHDNASGDGTADAVRAELAAVEVEASDTNLGFAAGMNRLIARSDAPWFFALNSDAWLGSPGALAALVAAGEAHPEAALIAPLVRHPSGTFEHTTYPFPSVAVAAAGAAGFGTGRLGRSWGRRRLLHGAWAHDVAREVDWAVGAAWLMRRSVIDTLGGFDESFFMYAEDLEWCWRVRDAGWTIWFDPAAEVIHVGNASGERVFGEARSAAWIANTYAVYRDHHHAASALLYQGFNALGATRAALSASARRQPAKARHWRRMTRAHLAPLRGSDRPGGGTR